MKKRLRIVSALIFIFLLAMPFQALAGPKDTPHSHDEETDDHEHEDDDHAHDDGDDHGHGDDDHAHDDDHGHGDDDHAHDDGDDHGHGDDGHAHDDGDDHGHGDDGHAHGDDDHTHDYEETGANLPLLSTFAALNGGFILFAAIRKINRKRKSGGK